MHVPSPDTTDCLPALRRSSVSRPAFDWQSLLPDELFHLPCMCWSGMPCYGGTAPLGNGSRKLTSRDDTAHGNSYRRKATSSWVPSNTRDLCKIVKSIYASALLRYDKRRRSWSIDIANRSLWHIFLILVHLSKREAPLRIASQREVLDWFLCPIRFFLFVLLHHWKKPRSGSIGIDNRSLWLIFLIILHFPKHETPSIMQCQRGLLDGLFFSVQGYFSVILNNWGKPRLWSIDIDNRSL